MSSSKKSASRYSSFDSQSSTSSSLDLKPTSKIKSFRKNSTPNSNFSSGVSKTQPKDAIVKVRNEQNFAAMVKKFMNKRSNSTSKKAVNGDLPVPLIVPADFIADDLKKTARKGSTFAALPKKLFGKGKGSSSGSGSSSSENKSKALTEVKANTRTLAMVLRSERELLALNKEQETQIAQLKSLLHGRNIEVEKLKDLCLKQREEIKALKSAILFPEEMNSQLQVLLEKQGSELKQAKQVIPSLQKQISSLTGQLQTLSEDLAEVKAVKYSSPRTPIYSQEEAANSLDFSSDDDDPTTPDSPNDMLLKDLNPCLTPFYSKMKSEDHEATDFDYTHDEGTYEVSPVARKLSRSSDRFSSSRGSTSNACVPFRMSDESKCRYGKRMVL